MSIQTEVNRIAQNVSDTLAVISGAGVTVPAGAKSDNLPGLAAELAAMKGENLDEELAAQKVLIAQIAEALQRKVSPPEVVYTPLAYLEASGTQYIDTGISGGSNAAYEIKLSTSGGLDWWDTFFAGSNGTTAPKIQFTGSNVIAHVPSHGSSWFNLFPGSDTAAHIVRFDESFKLYLDGAEIGYGADPGELVGVGWGDMTWYVFNSHAEPGLITPMRLYYLKMYTNGVLVRDFIPMRRSSDGACGLFDVVSGKFFENIGTGAFTGVAQSDYESAAIVEYAEALSILGVSV